MSNLECQNIKWFKAQQQPVITANVLIRPLLKCGSKTASFIHTQTQTCSFGSESTVTAGAEHIIALSQRSLTTDVIMQHGVVYENVYLWNKHQLRRGFFRPGGVPVQYLKTQTLTSENMGSFLAKSTTRVMAGVMILVNSLKASRSTLSLSDVGAGDCPMSSGWKTNHIEIQ